jgi:uncharacterized protein (TIGR03000 family)
MVLMAALTAGGHAPGWSCPAGCQTGESSHALYKTAGCFGCYGGWGGCWGKGGCFGASCYGAVTFWGGGWGGWTSGGFYGWSAYPAAQRPVPGTPYEPIMPGARAGMAVPSSPETVPAARPAGSSASGLRPSRARMIVELPVDARLYVDDQLVNTTTPRPVFSTPELDQGKVYYYMIRVELQRNGQTHSETRRIVLRNGEEVVQSFADLGRLTSRGTATADARNQP